MEPSMMIRGVVDNYHGVPSRVAGTASQMLEESEVGFLVEFPFLPLVNQLTIAQPNGSEVTDTLARGMVPEDRIDDFRRDPHPPPRPNCWKWTSSPAHKSTGESRLNTLS